MQLERLGPYKLSRLLGRGGMGAVYAAVNEETGENAAVKLLSGHLADDEAFRVRFKQEIESLKRLLHPHIVQLYGYGEEDGHLYYAMELVEGRTLQDELTVGRRFNWREVARIGIAVAQALKHAHDRGIIHRDLKPANLLVDAFDHVKLSDFGIAKLYGGTNVTAAGGVLGTADYMSPEQARGQQATSRCDLYSLGCVMYALLTGRPPFVGKSVLEVVTALQNDEPLSVRYWTPEAPEPFDKIVLQLLEKDPQRRIPTALALMNQLRAMEHALSLETRVMMDDEPAETPQIIDRSSSLPKTEIVNFGSRPTAPLKKPPVDEGDEYRFASDSATSITEAGDSAKASSRTALGTQAEKKTGAGADSSRATDVARSTGREKQKTSVAGAISKFTTVSEEELRGRRDADEGVFKQWLLAAAAAFVGLAAMGSAIFFATRPPSADRLYAAVKKVAAQGEPGQLAEIESEMTRFLQLYPADPRASDVRRFASELEQYRLDRQTVRERRTIDVRNASAVEIAYAEAARLSETDLEAALAHFEAIVAVFGSPRSSKNGGEEDKEDSRFVALAQKHVERLQADVTQLIAQQRAAVQLELERADGLAAADMPAARQIWGGIITLYGDKKWARPIVQAAKARLDEHGDAAAEPR
ncbi:MAG TPA: serine/threonine-protein kinase [Pirellulaceae bacterium]|jgi:serine/threonine-protein kinase